AYVAMGHDGSKGGGVRRGPGAPPLFYRVSRVGYGRAMRRRRLQAVVLPQGRPVIASQRRAGPRCDVGRAACAIAHSGATTGFPFRACDSLTLEPRTRRAHEPTYERQHFTQAACAAWPDALVPMDHRKTPSRR